MDLNERQKEAVEYNKGPLLILAGPGSGKTRVLTNKVLYLIENNIAKPQEIVAITFTNKASKEMKDRIYKSLKKDTYKLQISTFHSFGLKIIRENYNLLNLDKNFNILDDSDSKSLLKNIIAEMNLSTDQFDFKKIKNIISSCKNEFVLPEDYLKYHSGFFEEKISKIYKKYEDRLKKSSSLDFDDLLIKPIELFKNKDILEKYQYKYVLIDEYQDTNECQYILSKKISQKYKNICVVGDESQNVYSWRGANYKNILNFEKDYPNAKTILLEENYRSTKTIINAANCVIKNNKDRKDKTLFTKNENGEKIKIIKTYDEKEEAFRVIEEIKKLEDISFNEIAILYRTNAQSAILEDVLKKSNVPYQIFGGTSYYDRKEIKDLVAYLKLINNFKDDVSFLRIINFPKRKLGDKFIENIKTISLEKNISLFESLEDIPFKKMMLELIEKKDKVSLTTLIEEVLEKTKLLKEFFEDKDLSRKENLEEFKSITQRFEEENEDKSLENFLFEKSLVKESDELLDCKINLMTSHSAKGLEFEVVFLVGLEEGIFPHAISLLDNKELEEERRLFYVSITRAKKTLYFFHTIERNIYGRKSNNSISRFINEIDQELLDINKIKKQVIKDNVELIEGDKIKHDKFGEGIIITIKDSILTVAFNKNIGIKYVMKKYKGLYKI